MKEKKRISAVERRKRKRRTKKLITILCAGLAVLALLLAVAAVVGRKTENPKTETANSADSEETKTENKKRKEKKKKKTETSAEEEVTNTVPEMPFEEQEPISSKIEISADENLEDGFIKFPCEISDYDLVIEKLGSYSGAYVEDGTNEMVSDTAMILVKNMGNKAVEYAEITLDFQDDTLFFKVSALPAGESVIAMEQERKHIPVLKIANCTATVIEKDSMDQADNVISVHDNGDNTLTIKNLTNQEIPMARVFYKYYLEQQNAYLGGIAFTAKLTGLGANSEITIQPSHFESESCKIVMTAAYDEAN